MTFTDVAVNAKAADSGMDKPSVITAETFDGLTYTIKLGKSLGDENHYVAVDLAGQPVATRTPNSDEKAEDKQKLDKEFKQRLQKLEARVKREKTFTAWTYSVPKWKVEPLLKQRSELFVDNKQTQAARTEDANRTDPAPGLNILCCQSSFGATHLRRGLSHPGVRANARLNHGCDLALSA